MSLFSFNFRETHDWYVDNIDNTDVFEENKDVALYVIKQSEKYSKLTQKQIRKRKLEKLTNKHAGYLEAFVKRNVINVAKFKDKTDYKDGLYCVVDEDNIYAIFPTIKQGRLFADHLSFMQDNIHLTTYTPQPLCIDYGIVLHIPKCDIPDGTELPISGYETRVFNKMGRYKNDILDICRAPQIHQVGGTITKRKVSRKIYRKTPKMSPKLEQLLLRHHIKETKLFCIRYHEKWNVTTITKWSVSSDENEDGSFVVKSSKWQSVQSGWITFLSR